jgi:hypothetical protein
MNAIEFDAQICDGILKVLNKYKAWLGKNVRVILFEPEEQTNTQQLLKFSAITLQTKKLSFQSKTSKPVRYGENRIIFSRNIPRKS